VDRSTVTEVVADLKSRFKLNKVIFVGDRGMLSDDNVDALLIEEFGYIVAHPLRRGVLARVMIKGEVYRSLFSRCIQNICCLRPSCFIIIYYL
jgi:hypothetical protein